jgi:hypothetical protein
MLKRDLARNCIDCIAPRNGTDAIHPQRVGLNHPPLRALYRFRGKEKTRPRNDLCRNRIGRTGPYRIGAQLPIQSGYNRIGDFIGKLSEIPT